MSQEYALGTAIKGLQFKVQGSKFTVLIDSEFQL
jgi:hypothetical protein